MARKILVIACMLILASLVAGIQAQDAAKQKSETKTPAEEGMAYASIVPEVKLCIMEMQPTTRVVRGSVCKEYCQPTCCLFELLRGCCGCCGKVRTKRVLTKKTVPGCEVPKCVLKSVPLCEPCTGACEGGEQHRPEGAAR